MGHPKKQRKKYEKPKRPYDKSRIEKEKKILKDFGLRRKKEIWKAESILRDIRQRARKSQASKDKKQEKELLHYVNKIGLLEKDITLDAILSLKIEDILSRRLQTILYKKGMADSIKHARQLIIHGHVSVGGQKASWPSYIVEKGKESEIKLSLNLKKEKTKIAEPKEGKKEINKGETKERVVLSDIKNKPVEKEPIVKKHVERLG